MKRAYGMQLLVLVLAIIMLTATSAWTKTKKPASETDADATKKKTTAGKDETKDKDKAEAKAGNDALFPDAAKDAKDAKDAKKTKDDVKLLPDLEDLYAEMAEVVKLDEEGQKKLLNLQELKNKKLEQYDNKYSKIIVGIENKLDRTTNEKQRKKLLLQLSRISSGREKLEQQADNQAMRFLRMEQRVAWNTYELWTALSPEFDFDDETLALTDEQVEKSREICGQIAQKKGTKGRIAQNAQVKKAAIGQIGRKVLTKPQQKAYTIQQRRKRIHEEANGKTTVKTRRGRHH